jgi:hypothetical protein
VQRLTGFLFFQWGNSITQNASLPLPYPLKVVRFTSFACNHACPTEKPLYHCMEKIDRIESYKEARKLQKGKIKFIRSRSKKCRAETLIAIAFLGGFLEDVVHGCRWTKLKVECG